MEKDRKLEKIIAKDKGYSAPRCAYCTDEIKEEDDAKFSTLSDGNRYPVHKACHDETKQVPNETREELTTRVESWTEHTTELEQQVYDRTHTSGKTIAKQVIRAFLPGSVIYEDFKYYDPVCSGVKTFCDLFASIPIVGNIVEGNYALATGAYLALGALKTLLDYPFMQLETKELQRKHSFAKWYLDCLEEKLAKMPANDKTADKKTSSD
ncbi:hypothetical protein J4219_00070 [Candidatus Woesearchaeota archaeon]|nr:hypothetical protein [Candidatus Woesearchaeota archaeon]